MKELNTKEKYAKQADDIMKEFENMNFTKLASGEEELADLKKKVLDAFELKSEQKIESFKLLNSQRYYLKLKNGDPAVYHYKLRTKGMFPKEEIFSRGIRVLLERLEKFEFSLENDIRDKVYIEKYDNFCKLMINYETTTLINILKSYLYTNPDVKYVGYDIPHPLDHLSIIKISLNKGNDKKSIKNCVLNMIDVIKKQLLKLEKEYIKEIGKNNKKEKKKPDKQVKVIDDEEDSEPEISDSEENSEPEISDSEEEDEEDEVVGVSENEENTLELADQEDNEEEVDDEATQEEITENESGSSEPIVDQREDDDDEDDDVDEN